MNKITFQEVTELDYSGNEAYNALRTNIQFCGDDKKVIAFTSSYPDEGKSTLVFRLSQAMARTGKKVLLIDADIRKSVLANRYKADKQVKGLTEYLSGQCKINEIVYATNFEGMDVVFTGPIAPNPSELLGGEMMGELLNLARSQYDYTFIDCPPLGAVIDAAVIAQRCDGAIIVIETENVSYKIVDRVKKQLEQSKVKILGAVLNKIDMETKSKYGGYYGQYGYGHYGEYGHHEETK